MLGDFPNLDRFVAQVREYDFTKFPKLDMKIIEAMDKVLSTDVPQLMNMFPVERQEVLAATTAASAAAVRIALSSNGL